VSPKGSRSRCGCWRSGSARRTPQRTSFGIELHQPLGDVLDHVAQQIAVGSLLGELSQCDIVLVVIVLILGELRCVTQPYQDSR